MSRSPLTDTFQKVQGMVSYVQQNLSGDEYNLFLDMVAPQPEPEPAAKKTRKKRAARSASVDGMARAIKGSLQRAAAKTEGGNGADLEPEDFGPRCGVCGHGEQYQDHFQPSPNYHPFDSPLISAGKKSRTKAAAANITPNSEIEQGAAIGAGS